MADLKAGILTIENTLRGDVFSVVHTLLPFKHLTPSLVLVFSLSIALYLLCFKFKLFKALTFLPEKLLKKLPILDRYLIKEFIGPFVLSLAGFTLIAMVDILFFLIEEVVVSGVSWLTVFRLLLYKLPEIMVLFLPMSVLFATMLLLVRMAKDNELTILRCSGISNLRIIIPLILLTASTSSVSYLNNEKLVPFTQENAEKLIQEEINKTPPPNIVEDIVFKADNDRFLYIKKVYKKERKMEKIVVFEPSLEFPRTLTAEKAYWRQTKWVLQDGYIQDIDKDGNMQFRDHFDELTIHVPQATESFYERQKTTGEMDLKELKSKIRDLEKGGVNTRELQVEYYMKTSIPFACFIFGIMGIAYCLSWVKSGKDWWGVVTAIIIAVLSTGLYFFVLAFCRALGKDGTLTPIVSAWLPNVVYLCVMSGLITYQCKLK